MYVHKRRDSHEHNESCVKSHSYVVIEHVSVPQDAQKEERKAKGGVQAILREQSPKTQQERGQFLHKTDSKALACWKHNEVISTT